MAASSIIENIKVHNPTALIYYVEAMERGARNRTKRTDAQKSGVITDPERIRRLMQKVMEKKAPH